MDRPDSPDLPAPVPLPRRAGIGSRARAWSVHLARNFLAATVYRWYGRRLLSFVMSEPMPGHVAMILDGNRRFARQFGLSRVTDGHRQGARKLMEVIAWCDQLGIDTVTLWGLSTSNFTRPRDELDELFRIIREQLRSLRDHHGSVAPRRVRVLGRVELLPPELQDDLKVLEKETAGDGPRFLNIALAYGGRDEIIDAFRRMLADRQASGATFDEVRESVSESELRRYLYTGDETPDPDLIIRTSGEVRLSGFLLWQSADSELYFCDPYWPAFRKIDLFRAIRSYQQRQRRFGA